MVHENQVAMSKMVFKKQEIMVIVMTIEVGKKYTAYEGMSIKFHDIMAYFNHQKFLWEVS